MGAMAKSSTRTPTLETEDDHAEKPPALAAVIKNHGKRRYPDALRID